MPDPMFYCVWVFEAVGQCLQSVINIRDKRLITSICKHCPTYITTVGFKYGLRVGHLVYNMSVGLTDVDGYVQTRYDSGRYDLASMADTLRVPIAKIFQFSAALLQIFAELALLILEKRADVTTIFRYRLKMKSALPRGTPAHNIYSCSI